MGDRGLSGVKLSADKDQSDVAHVQGHTQECGVAAGTDKTECQDDRVSVVGERVNSG